MAKQLQPISIVGPGSWGLNTEEARKEIDPRWAIKALNCVISDSGVIASRKGWTALTDEELEDTPPIEQIYEYLDEDGVTAIISAADKKLYQGTTDLTEITGSIEEPSANNWKFVTMKGDGGGSKVIGMQQDHTPIVKDGADDGDTFSDISESSGSLPTGNDCLAAYGRLWAVDSDKTTVKWSDLLDETAWDEGSAGSLDTYSVWTSGVDEIVALAAFKNRLIIFGEFETLIYVGTADPTSSDFQLEDSIKGIGCVARDSVQNIGDDILFLSSDGLQSLSRAIQGGDIPLNDLSVNVRTDFLEDLAAENSSDIRSAYYELEGKYLITMPSSDRVWVFDVAKRVPEQGVPRVTVWDSMTPHAMHVARDNTLYFGQDGVVGEYGGGSSTAQYQDDGSTYRMEMRHGRTSGEQGPVTKIAKGAKISVSGGYNQVVSIIWELDWQEFSDSLQASIESGDPSYWNNATWNDSYWAAGLTTDELRIPLSGTGNNGSFEFRYDVDGFQLILHKIDVFMKAGRLG